MATASAIAAPAVLLSLSLDGCRSLVLTLNLWLLLVLAFVVGVVFLFLYRPRLRLRGPSFEIDRAEIGFGSGKISFKPSTADQQIAYAIWVELSTRKIGLPIDLDHDVVWEIYDSWYKFFSVTRDLIKGIPVSKLRNPSTQKIIDLSIDVLNEGLRPHLTRWQARFRHWYEKRLSESAGEIDPQTTQSEYPFFAELRNDLLEVNRKLIRYRKKMRELAFSDQ